MTDAQDRYRRASSGFDVAVNAVGPDQWDTTTPCQEWKARDVVAHVVEGHRGVISNVRGGWSSALRVDEDPKRAWQEVSNAMAEITDDPEVLAKELDGPNGRMPAGEIIGRLVSMDLVVHTWDLGQSVGLDVRLDEELVQAAYETLKPMDQMMRQPGVFGPKVEPPAGADPQTEFLCFLGRRP
jgi:uncharacterized protein (TIGR03086 family)